MVRIDWKIVNNRFCEGSFCSKDKILHFVQDDREEDHSLTRRCEPPEHEWQELLNHNKGAWQSAFNPLSMQLNCRLPHLFAEQSLSPTIKAKQQNGSQ